MSNGAQAETQQEDLTSFLKRVGAQPVSKPAKAPEVIAKPPAPKKEPAALSPPPDLPLDQFLTRVGARPAPQTLAPPPKEEPSHFPFGLPSAPPARKPGTEPGPENAPRAYWEDVKALFKYPSSVIQRASVEAAKAGPGGSTAVNVPGVMLQDMHDAWVEQMDRVGRAKNAWDEHPSLESLARFYGQAGAAAMPGFTGPAGVAVGAMIGATEEESEQTGDPYTALGHYAAAVTFMAGPKVSKPIGKVVGRAAEVAGEIKKGGVRAGLQTITGTGPRLIEQAEEARTAKVTKQEAGYQEDLQKAQAKQEQLAEKIRTKHEAKVQVIKQKYAEEVRRANQQKLEKSKAEAKRTALERYTSRLAEAWDENVKNTHRAVRAWLDTRWNDLRAKIEGAKASVDLTPVQQAVLHAQNSILRGSREKIAIFNSILKEGNPLEDASVFQGAGASARAWRSIPGTVNISELIPEVRQRIGSSLGLEEPLRNESAIIDWNNARGYSSELYTKMHTGDLPGDVYHAIKHVRDTLEGQLERTADQTGTGNDYRAVKADWRQYMDIFHDMRSLASGGSPLARSLRAKDLPYSVRPILGPAAQRALRDFARYKRFGANTEIPAQLGRIDSEMKALPKRATEIKEPEHPAPGWMKKPEISTLTPPPRPEPIPPVEPLAVTKEQLRKEAATMRRPSPWAIALGAWEAFRGKFPLWWVYAVAKPFMGSVLESDKLARYLADVPEKGEPTPLEAPPAPARAPETGAALSPVPEPSPTPQKPPAAAPASLQPIPERVATAKPQVTEARPSAAPKTLELPPVSVRDKITTLRQEMNSLIMRRGEARTPAERQMVEQRIEENRRLIEELVQKGEPQKMAPPPTPREVVPPQRARRPDPTPLERTESRQKGRVSGEAEEKVDLSAMQRVPESILRAQADAGVEPAKMELERREKAAQPPAPLAAPPTESVEQQIRHAYLALSEGRLSEMIRLADLKRALSHIPSQKVNEALFSMQKRGEVSLQTIESMQQTTEADRRAAIKILGEDRNIVYLF